MMKLDNPLLEYLGISLLEWEPGRCVFDLEIEPELYAEDGRLIATAQGTFKRSSSATSA